MKESKTTECRVSDLCEIISGGTPKTSNSSYWDGPIPWIAIKDIQDALKYIENTEKSITEEGLNNSSTHLLEPEDIIISARGTVGKIAMIKKNMAFNQSCFALRSKKIDPQFLFYALKNKVNEVKTKTHGTVFNTIIRKTFDEITITVPEKETQKKIGQILGWLDQAISLLSETNQNLEDLATLLFKQVTLETGKDYKVNDLPLLVTDYVANGSFKSLKENVTILQNDGFAYFIRNTDLKTKTFNTYVDQHSYEFLSKSSLFGGEIIISNVGDVGKVYLCPKLDKPMTLGNNVIVLKPLDEKLRYYLYLWFKKGLGKTQIDSITSGSVQMKFNKTNFRNLRISFPKEKELETWSCKVKPLFELIEKNRQQISSLENLRDFLLPKLISGQIDVSDLDI